MSLVAHLRGDNTRLREELVHAQRDAEALARERGQAAEGGPLVDFGHLLALVKEFGDGLGSLGDCSLDASEPIEPTSIEAGAQVFTICSPRNAAEGTDGGRGAAAGAADTAEVVKAVKLAEDDAQEAMRLRAELEASRAEVMQLRAALAARDVELAAVRHGCPVCKGSSSRD